MEQDSFKATELDKMTSGYNLQMLKAALAYFPASQKRLLSVLVKFQELKNTVNLFSSPEAADALSICSASEGAPKKGFFDVLNEIKDYGSPEQKKAFDRLNYIIQLSSLYDQMPQGGAAAEPAGQTREEPAPFTVVSGQPAAEEEEKATLSAASLDPDSPSGPSSSEADDDFRSFIRGSLSSSQQALFDSYSAMFHSLNNAPGKEPHHNE
ncbi:hypothetical protein [Qiania dongpingensis]|uniref:Uncharacterized protein n=1 Tax=Qiania dongpingensis TaxID=2763669 RepID=A0A7G9G660_9FIRM|nr:hypothetical protein [Qiania dongpingensis]QNM06292.1 hypothetical protein H9Q78_03880 [Qiania dongpingensis]